MSTLPTPRTDANFLREGQAISVGIGSEAFVPADFARQLERELTEAKAALTTSMERLTLELREAKAERDALKDTLAFGQENCDAEYNRLRDERDEMTKVAQGACKAEGEALKREDRWRALAEELAGALDFIVSECDWEEGTHTGDNRIGDACSKALTRFRDAANPASARTPPGTNERSRDEC